MLIVLNRMIKVRQFMNIFELELRHLTESVHDVCLLNTSLNQAKYENDTILGRITYDFRVIFIYNFVNNVKLET
jgi:hypothetical protein